VLGNLGSLSLKELELLADLPRFSSLRGLARSRGIEAAQLTRTLQKLEQVLGKTVLERAPGGSKVTDEGIRLAAVAANIVETAQQFVHERGDSQSVQLTLGTRGFLNYAFSEAYAKVCYSPRRSRKDLVLRFLDMSPEELKIAEHKRLIQLAIHLGEMDWTQAWESTFVGRLRWSLFVRKDHELQKLPSLALEDLQDRDFVGPCYWMGNEIKEGDDGFPIPLRMRKVTVFSQSAMSAIELARHSDAIVFAPNIITQKRAEMDELCQLKVTGTEDCFQKVFLSVRTDAVPKVFMEQLIVEMKAVLE
jgi:DNA-binding transcriptional LysR family regulator